MSECPEVVVLEGRGWTPEVRAHVAACGSCRLVMELVEERSQAAASRDRRAECVRFEALLAVRVAGGIGGTAAGMLDAHLEDCAECRAIAETMAPSTDRMGDQTALPTIDTSAYALGPEVARGGMGRIVSARDLRIGRPVAVKELLARTASQAARFEREARVTARLQHPGIVPIYEIGRWANGTPFYAMRMVAGRTLRAELADRTTVAARLALLPAVITATEAVAFAHANRVIHRDLTPSNIMVGDYGETVVIDWGLAKDLADETLGAAATDDVVVDAGPYRRDPNAPDGLTVDGAVIGTASYMPPEQAAGDRVDARADVYALGAILYHVLVGQAPYRGRNDAVLAAVKAGPPPAVATAAPNAPRDLVSIVDKAMARNPADRYPSARELAGELTSFQAGRLVEAHHYSRGELARRWILRRRAAVVVSAIALLVLVTGGAFAVVNIFDERDRAESGEHNAVVQREAAKHASTTLLVELGRQKLLAGEAVQAASLLSAAYSSGDTTAELRFMLGSAMRAVEALEYVLAGTGGPVRGMSLDRAQQRVLVVHTAGADQWSIADGRRLATLTSPGVDLHDGAYSADGQTIITWGDDRVVRVWDAETGRLVRRLETTGARLAALSDDGTTAWTVGADGIARAWDVSAGKVVDEKLVLHGAIRGAFSAGGFAVVVSVDGPIAVRDWKAGTQFSIVDTELGAPPDLSADGSHLLTCGGDETRLWDRTGKRVRTWKLAEGHQVGWCRFDADGSRVLTTDSGGLATIRDVASGELLAEVSIGVGPTLALLARSRIVSGSVFTNTVSLRDAETGIALAEYPSALASSDAVLPLVVSAGAHERLVLAREDGAVAIIDLASGRMRARFVRAAHPGERIAHVGPDAILTSNGAQVTLWDAPGEHTVAKIALHAASDGQSELSEGGRRVVAVDRTGRVVVLDARNGAEVRSLAMHAPPDVVGLDHSGRRLVAWRKREPIEVWDLASGARIAIAQAAEDGASPALADDGRSLVLFRQFGSLTIEPLDGSAPRRLSTNAFQAEVSRDGRRVAYVDEAGGGKAVVADVSTGEHLLEVPDGALSLAFDGTGDLLATVGASGIQLRRVSSKHLVLTVETGVPLAGAALSPDGSLLETSGGVWSASDGRQLAAAASVTAKAHPSKNAEG